MNIQKSFLGALLLAVCCVLPAAVQGQTTPLVTFQTVPLAIPGETMAFSDFNGDGKQDAVGLDSKSSSIAVWLGDGDGTFAATPLETPVSGNPPYSFAGSKLIVANVHDAVPNNPQGVAFSVSQFNSTGALVEYGVILADGIGNGYFGLCENDIICLATSPKYTVGPTILGLVAADFLAQSYPSTAFAGFTDIVIATQFPDLTIPGLYDNSFLFYEGDGKGGLTNLDRPQNVLPAQTNATTQNPSAMAADLLGNGYPYLVFNPGYATSNGVLSPTGLGLAVNNQNETFTATATPLLSGTTVAQYLPIDVNEDKNLDIVFTGAVTSSSPSTVIKVILGDGTGNFSAPATLVAAPSGMTGTLGFSFVDLNNDGKLDLVFSGQSNGLYWSSGNGDGTFNSAALITAADNLSSFVSYPQPHLLGATTTFAWGQKAAYVVALGPSLLLNPASTVKFGGQFVGGVSAPQPVTLTNTGGQPLALSSIATSAGFSSTPDCGSTLAAGATCTVQVSFAPTATGDFTGTLTVTSDAANSPQVESLSGTGTTVTVAPASDSSASSTINSGATATFVLAVSPVSGFTGPLTTSCAGAPTGYQCAPSQATVNVAAAPQNVTFTVSPSSSAKLQDGSWFGSVPAVLVAGVFIGFVPRRYRRRMAMCGLLVITLAGFTGCGSGSNGKSTANQVTNTYPLTATFTTSGGQTVKQSLTLTITSNH